MTAGPVGSLSRLTDGCQTPDSALTEAFANLDAMSEHTTQRPGVVARRVSRRAVLSGALGLVATAGAGTAWALDRFVVEHAEVANASSSWTNDAATGTSAPGSVSGDTFTGANGTIGVKSVATGSGSDKVTYFVADIELTSGTAIRSAFADDTFGENTIEVPSVIAEANGAIWAINGDYYGFRQTGIVIRNGVAFRDKGARQGLALYRDGSMRLYDETATDARALVNEGVWQTLTFGPGLVDAGKVVSGIDNVEVDTNVGNHSVQGQQPRTGIGLVDTNHLVAVVADGRSSGYSRGVTMIEFAEIFAGLGAQVAYNLDGGGSSAMYFDGALVNNPLGRGTERGTSDILYVAS